MIPDQLTPVLAAAFALEIVISLAGFVVWWRGAFSQAARAQSARLAPWPVSPSDFLVCALVVVGCWFSFQLLGHAALDPLLKKFSASPDTCTTVYGAAGEFGLLAGVAGACAYLCTLRESTATEPPHRTAPSVLRDGILTFLAVVPAVYLTSLVWNKIIGWLGLPPEPQDLVDMFARAKLSLSSAGLFLLATVAAPVGEELVFRAGLFRYLRTRIPRWAALTLPALFFATLHWNWASLGPIAALAIIFSLAYERTGSIRVTMIAHCLFNLNTILLILAGVRN